MSKIRVFIVGDSHTDAIKWALKTRGNQISDNVEIEAYRYSKIKNGKMIGDLSIDSIVARISTLAPQDLIISTIGGNQHQTLSLVQHPIPFDLIEPGYPSMQSTHDNFMIIPRAQMLDFFEKGMRGGDGKRMQHLRANSSCQIFHLVPPPPKEDAQHILNRFETKFADLGLLEKGVTPAAIRLKMWRLQVEVLRQLTTEYGIGLMNPPENTVTSLGFLEPLYYANDATHGNALYGESILNQIEELLNNVMIHAD